MKTLRELEYPLENEADVDELDMGAKTKDKVKAPV